MALKNLMLALCMAACIACSGTANGAKMSDVQSSESAWQSVLQADSDATQRARLEAFLALHPQGTEPRLTVSVADAATGSKAPIDKALWDNPQLFRVTLRYGEETYVFMPRSRASLEPLFRE